MSAGSASTSADSSGPDLQAPGSQRQGDETFFFSIKGHLRNSTVSGAAGINNTNIVTQNSTGSSRLGKQQAGIGQDLHPQQPRERTLSLLSYLLSIHSPPTVLAHERILRFQRHLYAIFPYHVCLSHCEETP